MDSFLVLVIYKKIVLEFIMADKYCYLIHIYFFNSYSQSASYMIYCLKVKYPSLSG